MRVGKLLVRSCYDCRSHLKRVRTAWMEDPSHGSSTVQDGKHGDDVDLWPEQSKSQRFGWQHDSLEKHVEGRVRLDAVADHEPYRAAT